MSVHTKGVLHTFAAESMIYFKDKSLESAIKTTLNLAESEGVSTLNILNLTHLRALDKDISDLSGLEYAENLQLVTFTGNDITSLEPLKNLNHLYSVGFAYNSNLKMEELLKLEHITELDLSGNEYSGEEFDQLEKYSELTVLWLNSCQLNSISFMSGMNKLVQLQIQNNNLTNIDALNSSRLIGIWATNNRIVSLKNVANLSGLKRLWIDNNQLTSLDWLDKLGNVSHVYASNNKIEKAVISGHQYIYLLQLDESNITEIELTNLPSLMQISLNYNRLASFSQAANLPALQSVSLIENTELTNIEGISAAPKLVRLVLQGCPGITDFSPVSSSEQLVQLFCNNTGITDEQIRDIGFKSKLILLAVAGGKLSNIDFISQFPAITQLALMDNRISDISQLGDNISRYSATDQKITLDDVAIGEKTEISLKGRYSQRVDNIEWLTEGNISTDGDKQFLTWAESGDNKLNFSWQDNNSTEISFSGTFSQTVHK
ncbi:Internalin-A precursor [Erwinia amylovora Ea644]|uniref:leucine-rich repeat domain-containing protein n=1 Tax=Erwinia amylovora TaxID=552 RepID=UPI0002CAB7C6|nr:leucine-rich repeat domain-containing protein [Erwinia amylovora]CCP02470.1 Internalin-A precursor [Erwinia amylovora Ea644]